MDYYNTKKISNAHYQFFYTEKLYIAIYVLFYNDNSRKYWESKENRGAMVISQNTKDSKNYIKLLYRL